MVWEQDIRSRGDSANEARQIAEVLDGGNVGIAEQVLSKDLYSLQGRAGEQQELLSMVNRFDRKNYGADLQILDDRSARVVMNAYEGPRFPYGGQAYANNDRQYPYQEFPYQQSQYDRNAQYNPYYENRAVVIAERRPDAASRVLEGVAIGVGSAIGREIIDSAFGRDRNCEPRHSRRIEPRIHYPASPHYDPRPGYSRPRYEPIPRNERHIEPRIHYPASPQHQRPHCPPRIQDNHSRYEYHQRDQHWSEPSRQEQRQEQRFAEQARREQRGAVVQQSRYDYHQGGAKPAQNNAGSSPYEFHQGRR